MKRTYTIALLIFTALCLAGCAEFAPSIFGNNIKDLERAKETGETRVFTIAYDNAYDKMKQILLDNKLKIYQSNRKEKYIVAMGLPQQINTTRIGIFFDSISADQTKITLTSLSTTALKKTTEIIFAGFEK